MPSPGAEFQVTIAIAISDPRLREEIYSAMRSAPVRMLGDISEIRSLPELIAEVDRARPDILLLGVPGLPVDYMEAIRRLRSSAIAPHVVVVNASAEPENILGAMRAGASEYLYPPFAAQFSEAISRIAAECAREQANARPGGLLLAFVSGKGGCGATTIACHAAAYLRRATKKQVLVADLDPCSGVCPVLFEARPRYTVVDVLENLHRLDLTLWKALAATTESGVDLIAAPGEPVDFALHTRGLPVLLRFWRTQYDYTIVDLGHGMAPPLYSMIQTFDHSMLVGTGEAPALRMTQHIIRGLTRANYGPNRLKLILNRVPRRPALSVPDLERALDFPAFTSIAEDPDYQSGTQFDGRMLRLDSHLGMDIARMISKLAGLPDEKVKKPHGFTLFGWHRTGGRREEDGSGDKHGSSDGLDGAGGFPAATPDAGISKP